MSVRSFTHVRRATCATRRPLAAAGALLLSALAARDASATCGSANCFLVRGTSEALAADGAFTVDLSWRYVAMDRKLEGSDTVGTVLTPKIDFENETIEPDHHAEISTINSYLDLAFAWGATPRFTVIGVLPIVARHDHEHFDDASGPAPVFNDSDGGAGFGDARVGVRYGFLVGSRNLLAGSLVVEAPTGAWKLHDAEGGVSEPGLQPGNGAWDFLAGLYYAHQVRPERLEWFVNGTWRRNGENGLDYAFGGEAVLSSGLEAAIGSRAFWSIQVNGRRAGRDQYLGDGVPSTGSTWVALTPGLRSAGPNSVYAFVQIPVYEQVNETNLAPRYGLEVGFSKTF
jgi:hypothetical protein